MSRIGILDWGVGGFGFFKMLKEHSKDASVVYVSDSGFMPYGKVPTDALAKRVERVVHFMKELDVDRVVVACNAASTVLPRVAATNAITGVIEPTITKLCSMSPAKIGIIGGRRTVLSRVYGDALKRSGHAVRQRVAQPLSAFVEAGELDTTRVRTTIEEVIEPLNAVDVLVMACTHYPALLPHFKRLLPHAVLIDPAAVTWDWAVTQGWNERPASRSKDLIFTTGDADGMIKAAALAFSVRIEHVERVVL